MRFFPLAIAEMAGEGICVAGVDIGSMKWVRPVVRGRRCLFANEARRFQHNCVHEIQLGVHQKRGRDIDPKGYHTEDHVLVDVGQVGKPPDPASKGEILERAADHDLLLAIKSGHRSLFLVQALGFQYRVDTYGKHRFSFQSTLPSTLAGTSSAALAGTRIAVGQRGPPCTCPRWSEYAASTWPGEEVTDRHLEALSPDARLFLALSLSALYDDKYWLIAAGVHIVGEDRIWL